MQTRNTLLDDLARVATGALGIAAGLRREAEELLRARFAAVLGAGDFVTREEFSAVKAMAARARAENEALAERLRGLEKRLGAKRRPPARKPRAAAKGAGAAKGPGASRR